MRIIPVLDLMAGQVVRGVGGRRREYRPIVSSLTQSCHPLAVGCVLRDAFGLTEFYLADLDAIAGAEPAWHIYRSLQEAGIDLMVDAGVRGPERALALAAAGVAVVVGLETVAGPDVLAGLVRQLGPDRVLFSLDLKDGEPLGNRDAWDGGDPLAIAAAAVACGVRRLIVLDLTRVGGGGGAGTEDLCRHLTAANPNLEVIAGGGVGQRADLQRLREGGVQAALVASALHDGRLRPEDCRDL